MASSRRGDIVLNTGEKRGGGWDVGCDKGELHPGRGALGTRTENHLQESMGAGSRGGEERKRTKQMARGREFATVLLVKVRARETISEENATPKAGSS